MMSFKKFIDNFEECVGVFLSIVMSLAVTVGIVTRTIGVPMAWSNEVARYVFIWMVMMGAVVATKRNGHIIIDVFINLFPETLRERLRFLGSILTISMLAILVYFGTLLSMEFWGTTMSLLPYPIGLVYASLPTCSLLMIIRMIQNIVREHRSSRAGASPSGEAAR